MSAGVQPASEARGVMAFSHPTAARLAATHGQGVKAKLGAEATLVCPALLAVAITRYCCPDAREPTVQLEGALALGLPGWVAAAHVGFGVTQLVAAVPSHRQTLSV